MRLGIIRTFIGNFGQVGYYNVQELGLARALNKNIHCGIYIFTVKDKKYLKEVKEYKISDDITFVDIPGIRIGNHGIFNPSILDRYDLEIIQLLTDIELMVPFIIKWAEKHNKKILTYTGTIESNSNNIFKKLAGKITFYNNSLYLKKYINIAKTPYVYEKLKKKNFKKTHMIPVGLDFELLNTNTNIYKNEIRNKLGILNNKKVILFVGRLEKNKRPDFAIKLLNYLIKYDSNYNLILMGDGKLKDDLLCYINENNLKDKVFYYNKISNCEMWKYYVVSDISINPCATEIYGMAILEAMYYMCPVIAYEAPGPKYIIDNNVDGYLIDNYDCEEWKKYIEKALNNKDLIGKNARNKIIDKFNWDIICNDYIKIYNEL